MPAHPPPPPPHAPPTTRPPPPTLKKPRQTSPPTHQPTPPTQPAHPQRNPSDTRRRHKPTRSNRCAHPRHNKFSQLCSHISLPSVKSLRNRNAASMYREVPAAHRTHKTQNHPNGHVAMLPSLLAHLPGIQPPSRGHRYHPQIIHGSHGLHR